MATVLKDLLFIGSIEAVKNGDFLYEQGTVARNLYFITKGRVRLVYSLKVFVSSIDSRLDSGRATTAG